MMQPEQVLYWYKYILQCRLITDSIKINETFPVEVYQTAFHVDVQARCWINAVVLDRSTWRSKVKVKQRAVFSPTRAMGSMNIRLLVLNSAIIVTYAIC